MPGLEITVLLGAAILVGAALAPRLRIATPLLLLIVGLALGLVPELPAIELPPETVLLLFLPVLLFWESLTTSLRSIKRDLRGIVILSTLLVVATAFAVAGIAAALGIPWNAALILGAAVAPPDATAVAALGRTLPHRNFMLLKAESLTNDGTALVVYAIAVGVAVGGHYTPLDITRMVLLSYLGGLAAGAVVAGAAILVLRRVSDAITINVGLLLTPFVAYLLAESIHASGVLAVVVAGLLAGVASPRISTAGSRRQTESAWPLGSYVLNGALFVLIGLQVQAVAHQISVQQASRLVAVVAAVWIGLVLVRFVFQTVTISIIRLLDRRPSQRSRRMTYRARVVSSFAGFRGAVSLAIALSVPVTLADGRPFPGRKDIVFVTAGVIVVTLLAQGPLLPAIVRWARLPEDTTDKEQRVAEHTITTTALTALPELADEHGISQEVRDRLTRDYQEHLQLVEAKEHPPAAAPGAHLESLEDLVAVHGKGIASETAPQAARVAVTEYSPLARNEEYTRLRLALLDRKRDVLNRFRREGVVDDSVARRIQTRLDVEELRLTGVEPMD